MSAAAVDDKPKAKVFREKIGNKEFELREERLDVLNDVTLWPNNPRLLPKLADGGFVQSEDSLENYLRGTNGYAPLAKSIADIGQMEPIYAWKREDQQKYLVLEGATRVTILRDLARKQGLPARTVHYAGFTSLQVALADMLGKLATTAPGTKAGTDGGKKKKAAATRG